MTCNGYLTQRISELSFDLELLEADAAAALRARNWVRLSDCSKSLLATWERLEELQALEARQSCQREHGSTRDRLERALMHCDAALERVSQLGP